MRTSNAVCGGDHARRGAAPGRGRQPAGVRRCRSCAQLPAGELEEDVLEGAAARWTGRAGSTPCSAHQALTAASTSGPSRAVDAGRSRRATSATVAPGGSAARSAVRSRPGVARKVSTSPPPVSSATVPGPTTRPWSTTTTWSASRSASSIRCVVSTTVTPSAAQLLDQVPGGEPGLRVHARRSARRGRPGPGGPTTAQASASRCFSPPDIRRYVARTPVQAEPLGEVVRVERVGVERRQVAQHRGAPGRWRRCRRPAA